MADRDALEFLLKGQFLRGRHDEVTAVIAALKAVSDKLVGHHESTHRGKGGKARYKVAKDLHTRTGSLKEVLRTLDSLYIDELESHLGPRSIAVILGDLARLETATTRLVRKQGRQENAAQHWWILRVADIFEHGMDAGLPSASVGTLYKLLKLLYPLHGQFPLLGEKQVRNILKIRDQSRSSQPTR